MFALKASISAQSVRSVRASTGRRHLIVQAFQQQPKNQKSTQNKLGRTLVMAVDNSKESDQAFSWLLDNLYRAGDNIHLVHVVPDLSTEISGGFVTPFEPEVDVEMQKMFKRQGLLANAEAYIKSEYVQRAKAAGAQCTIDLIEERVSHQGIGDTIIDAANKLNASTIVMASHRRSFVDNLILGSVSEYVSAKANRPVLVFH